jgi:hypothetical protein
MSHPQPSPFIFVTHRLADEDVQPAHIHEEPVAHHAAHQPVNHLATEWLPHDRPEADVVLREPCARHDLWLGDVLDVDDGDDHNGAVVAALHLLVDAVGHILDGTGAEVGRVEVHAVLEDFDEEHCRSVCALARELWLGCWRVVVVQDGLRALCL